MLSNDVKTQGTKTATLRSRPSHAVSFSFRSDGSFIYVAPLLWAKVDTFKYSLDGLDSPEKWATVSIIVGNSQAVAEDDQYAVLENVSTTIPKERGVLVNDVDPDDPHNQLYVVRISIPANGQAILNIDGSFTYTPRVGFFGWDEFTYFVDDQVDDDVIGFNEPNIGTVRLFVGAGLVDIDTDSDNTGAVERGWVEDLVEVGTPASILSSRAGALREPVHLTYDVGSVDLTGWKLDMAFQNQNMRVFTSLEGGTEILVGLTHTIGSSTQPIPSMLWVVGRTGHNGRADMKWKLLKTDGSIYHQDVVEFTIMDGGLNAWRQQTPVFLPFEISEPDEEGIGIRRNTDDDDKNFAPDALQAVPTSGENDLMMLDVWSLPSSPAGVRLILRRSSEFLKIWRNKDRSGELIAGQSNEADVTGFGTVWVEWAEPNLTGQVSLELFAKDVRSGNIALALDSVSYTPFTSETIVWIGEFQEPRDPAIYNGHFMGLMDWAIKRYREGFDVYAYEEADGWTESVLGPAYAEVKSAINDRKVSSIALIGYSHGGGTVWEMANKLTNNATDIYGSFEITFTGFIDAISQSWRWGAGVPGTLGSVNTRPPGSQYHCSQFQKNTWISGLFLNGDYSGGDDDLNRSYLGVTHSTIDENAIVLEFLEMRYKQKIIK